MAILKHIASKNSDYTEPERYLIFEHDEKTGKMILDAAGYPVLRDKYILDGINCDPGAFAAECRKANRAFKKNSGPDEIKTHHYIISFDPKDRELGLTMEKAHAMGMDFAKRYFPGHQALVCAHDDGSNGSGNIHVHIVINSLRIYDVPPLPYKQRKYDCKAGYKHCCTNAFLHYLREGVMKMCQIAGLNQVDLFHSDRRVTDQEYHAVQRGQDKLDQENAAAVAAGEQPKQTRFETEKEKLRQAILDAVSRSRSVSEFRQILLEEHGIRVKESRGRWSYLPPGRKQPITSRRLGDLCSKEAVTKAIQLRVREQLEAGTSMQNLTSVQVGQKLETLDISNKIVTSDLLSGAEKIGQIIDIERAGDSEAYAKWIKIHNLQEQAKTFNFMSEHGLLSGGELDEEYARLTERFRAGRTGIKDTEAKLKDVNRKLRLLGQYYKGKAVYREYAKGGKKSAFQKEHQAELTLYESASRELREIFGEEKLPALADLKAEKTALQTQKDAQYAEFKNVRKQWMELGKVIQNRDSFLAGHVQPGKNQKKEIT